MTFLFSFPTLQLMVHVLILFGLILFGIPPVIYLFLFFFPMLSLVFWLKPMDLVVRTGIQVLFVKIKVLVIQVIGIQVLFVKVKVLDIQVIRIQILFVKVKVLTIKVPAKLILLIILIRMFQPRDLGVINVARY